MTGWPPTSPSFSDTAQRRHQSRLDLSPFASRNQAVRGDYGDGQRRGGKGGRHGRKGGNFMLERKWTALIRIPPLPVDISISGSQMPGADTPSSRRLQRIFHVNLIRRPMGSAFCHLQSPSTSCVAPSMIVQKEGGGGKTGTSTGTWQARTQDEGVETHHVV